MKKLPFKPTALRRPSLPPLGPTEDDSKAGDLNDGLALFRRSKEMEPIMAADRERRLKKKQKQDEERRRQRTPLIKRSRNSDDGNDDEASLDGPREDGNDDEASLDGPRDAQLDLSKQPPSALDQSLPTVRLPSPSDGEDGFSEPVTPRASKRSRADSTPSSRCARSPLRQATPSKTSPKNAAAPPSAQTITLDSDDSDDDDSDNEDDDDVQYMATPSVDRSRGAVAQSEPPTDVNEFSEYVRRAEEQRARDKALLGSGPGKGPGRETVEILIIPRMKKEQGLKNAQGLRIKYLFDKPLRVVRNHWVAIQRRNGVQLSVQNDDDIILTWRKKKVFVFSTLLNLGIRPGGDGRLQVEGHGRDGLSNDRRGVEIEAWTPELFQEMERQEEQRRRKREAGELSESGDEAADESSSPDVKIRVILKARGLEDVKLTVRPETTVETLVTGFRTQRSIGSEKDVSMVFEGERLEEHVTMEDAEIADMDLIDVHVK